LEGSKSSTITILASTNPSVACIVILEHTWKTMYRDS